MSAPEFDARIEEALAKTMEALADGFDAEDVAVLVREAVEIADTVGDLDGFDGPEKRELAVSFACNLIDKFFSSATPQIASMVEAVDWPWITDGMEKAIVDPLVLKFAVPYARDLIKSTIPSLVDLVVNATKGKIAVNK